MSIKDLIWVQVAQSKRIKWQLDIEKTKRDAQVKDLEQLIIVLADLRTIAFDSNTFIRANALAGAKKTKIPTLDVNKLPSRVLERQREDEEKMSGMTEEQRAIYRFEHGGKYIPPGARK